MQVAGSMQGAVLVHQSHEAQQNPALLLTALQETLMEVKFVFQPSCLTSMLLVWLKELRSALCFNPMQLNCKTSSPTLQL